MPNPSLGSDRLSTWQCLRDHVPRVVKEVGAELFGGWIVSDDLKPAHVLFFDTAIRRVHDELPTRPPLVNVAREDFHRGPLGRCNSLTLGEPTANRTR